MDLGQVSAVRPIAQGLVDASPERTPTRVVEHLGCLPAQALTGALVSVARRGTTSTEAVGEAMDSGTIVRMWTQRGTLHLVPARDSLRSGSQWRRSTRRTGPLSVVDHIAGEKIDLERIEAASRPHPAFVRSR